MVSEGIHVGHGRIYSPLLQPVASKTPIRTRTTTRTSRPSSGSRRARKRRTTRGRRVPLHRQISSGQKSISCRTFPRLEYGRMGTTQMSLEGFSKQTTRTAFHSMAGTSPSGWRGILIMRHARLLYVSLDKPNECLHRIRLCSWRIVLVESSRKM